MLDGEIRLRGREDVPFEQQIGVDAHRTGDAVLHRHEAGVHRAGIDGVEHLLAEGEAHRFDGSPEVMQQGRFAVSAPHALERDLRRRARLRQCATLLTADAVLADLRRVLRLRPFDAGARLTLANLELSAGNWELAFLEYQSLTELHPEEPQGWIGLASILMRGGLLVSPEEALDKAIALAPRPADAHVLRADVRSRMGRFHGARLDAEAAVEAEPKDSVAWALLVRTAARSRGREAG